MTQSKKLREGTFVFSREVEEIGYTVVTMLPYHGGVLIILMSRLGPPAEQGITNFVLNVGSIKLLRSFHIMCCNIGACDRGTIASCCFSVIPYKIVELILICSMSV